MYHLDRTISDFEDQLTTLEIFYARDPKCYPLSDGTFATVEDLDKIFDSINELLVLRHVPDVKQERLMCIELERLTPSTFIAISHMFYAYNGMLLAHQLFKEYPTLCNRFYGIVKRKL